MISADQDRGQNGSARKHAHYGILLSRRKVPRRR
jgi:hypothetical protein